MCKIMICKERSAFLCCMDLDADIWRTTDWTQIHNVTMNSAFMLHVVFFPGYRSESWSGKCGKSHLRAQWKLQQRRWAWGHRWRCQSGKLLWTWGCPQWPAGGCTGILPRCTAIALLHREQAGLEKTEGHNRLEWVMGGGSRMGGGG